MSRANDGEPTRGAALNINNTIKFENCQVGNCCSGLTQIHPHFDVFCGPRLSRPAGKDYPGIMPSSDPQAEMSTSARCQTQVYPLLICFASSSFSRHFEICELDATIPFWSFFSRMAAVLPDVVLNLHMRILYKRQGRLGE